MSVLPVIWAQPLAPDYMWLTLLLVAALALLRSLGSLRDRTAECRHTEHELDEIGQRLHELISHRHH
jgi:hypothetical protein